MYKIYSSSSCSDRLLRSKHQNTDVLEYIPGSSHHWRSEAELQRGFQGGGGALMRNFMLYISGPNETWVRWGRERDKEKKSFYYTQLYLFNLARGVFRTSTETGRWEMPWYIKTRKERKKMNPIWRLCQNRGFISRKLVEQMSPRQDCQASSLHGGVLPGNRLCPSEVLLKKKKDVEVVN